MRTLEFRTGLMQDKSVTTIPARVFDPTRHAQWLATIGLIILVQGCVLVAAGFTSGAFAALLGLAALLLWDVRLRRAARDRTLVCKPGSIRTRAFGLIRARDIQGATTAHVNDRVSLVLSHRRRARQPITLELADEAALATVCKSLGIGHQGFGYIDFSTQPSREERYSRVFSAIGLVCMLLLPFGDVTSVLAGMTLALSVTLSASLALVRRIVPQPWARITSAGIFLPTGMFVPFQSIDDVRLSPNEIVFRIETERGVPELRVPIRPVEYARQGMTREELGHIVAQIRDASVRAHGRFRLKTGPEALAARLARLENENDADWHARLDTLAASGGYRSLSAEPAELWSLFEDPDADADVRAAAARVLRRVDEDALKIRVADVLATVRDEATRTRITDSLEDDEEPQPDSQSAAHS